MNKIIIINKISLWLEQKYGCTILLNKWEKDFSVCASYKKQNRLIFVISFSDLSSCLHEFGHIIEFCSLEYSFIKKRKTVVNELEAWRIAENLAKKFNLELDYDLWEMTIGTYVMQGLKNKTLEEKEVLNLFWGGNITRKNRMRKY